MDYVSDVETGDLLHGQQLVFHITHAQACLPYHPCPGLSSISPMPRPVFHITLAQACLPYYPCPGLSSISPLPKPVFHITLAQACLPHHPCPRLPPRDSFQGTDPWPLVTDGCHRCVRFKQTIPPFALVSCK